MKKTLRHSFSGLSDYRTHSPKDSEKRKRQALVVEKHNRPTPSTEQRKKDQKLEKKE